MAENKTITLEKREFKVSNGETFILEYPSNFEEITNKKLSKLQKEYDISKSNERNINDIDNLKNSDEINTDNNYYQKIGESKEELFIENKKIKLEPQKGFIDINKNKNKINDKSENIDDNSEEINSDEFYDVEVKENKKKENYKDNNIEEDKDVEEKKRNVSPVKDADNIKLAMKKLNFKTPKWAENMKDEDFINMVKSKIKK